MRRILSATVLAFALSSSASAGSLDWFWNWLDNYDPPKSWDWDKYKDQPKQTVSMPEPGQLSEFLVVGLGAASMIVVLRRRKATSQA